MRPYFKICAIPAPIKATVRKLKLKPAVMRLTVPMEKMLMTVTKINAAAIPYRRSRLSLEKTEGATGDFSELLFANSLPRNAATSARRRLKTQQTPNFIAARYFCKNVSLKKSRSK